MTWQIHCQVIFACIFHDNAKCCLTNAIKLVKVCCLVNATFFMTMQNVVLFSNKQNI